MMMKRVQCLIVGVVCFVLGMLAAHSLPPVFGQGTKNPTWLHALELSARQAGEKDFTDKTKTYGIEVYRDQNNGNLVYVSQTGSIAVVPAK